MKSMSDQQLALAVQSGDRVAAQALMERYQDGLFGWRCACSEPRGRGRVYRKRWSGARAHRNLRPDEALLAVGVPHRPEPVHRPAPQAQAVGEIDEERDAAPVATEGTNVYRRPPDPWSTSSA